ncbi:MAG: FMN-binding protein [Proteobacteria bacterium]|nr:FMN-binding protein [Pseudomonadota bacterium]
MNNDWFKLIGIPIATVVVSGHVYAAEYLSVEQAQKLMFGNSAVFKKSDVDLNSNAKKAIKNASGVVVDRDVLPAWKVFYGGNLSGYFIVDEVIGKHEYITYAVALSAQGELRQIEILAYRESYGYEVRNPRWREQFVGHKPGSNLDLGEEIKNISGATMSCRHITEGVNRVLATYDLYLKNQ